MRPRSRLHPNARLAGHLLGSAGLLLLWQVASHHGGLAISSPLATANALLGLLADRQFLVCHLLPTWACAFVSLLAAFAAGTALGLATGRSPFLSAVLVPLQWALLSAPAVVFVVIGMLWFGLGTRMVILVTFVLLVPFSYVSCADAMRELPADLLEVTAAYRLPLSTRLRVLYLPALRGPLAAGLALLSGNSVRLTVLCEVMGTDSGLGFELASARSNLDTPRLWGICLLCVLMVGATERLLDPWVKRASLGQTQKRPLP